MQQFAFSWQKITLALGLLLLVGVFFLLDLHHYLTLTAIKEYQEEAQEFYRQRPLAALVLFALVYLLVVGLSLPGALLLGLLAGAVFGVLVGAVLVSFSSSLAATLACSLSRYFFRDLVLAKFPQILINLDKGMAKEGAFYLFSLRLMPVVPFFVINLVMGLTAIRLRTFYWVSQLGMLPGTFVFVNAGHELGQLASSADIFSPRLLLAFALLGLLPLVTKRLLDFYRSKIGANPYQQDLSAQTNPNKPPDNKIDLARDNDHQRDNSPAPALQTTVGYGESENGNNLTPPSRLLKKSPVDLKRAFAQPLTSALQTAAEQIKNDCTGCGVCALSCGFLKQYGLPGDIAASLLSGHCQADPFVCSLCNLCAAVCPEKLEPGDFFLNLRRLAVSRNAVNFRPYRVILDYEKRGNSALFSWDGLPSAGHSVFFPGCSLPGTRRQSTLALFNRLREKIPNLGVVLACCGKPSHDLGRQEHFLPEFDKILNRLLSRGIREVLVACPNCYKVFKLYGKQLEVRSVWEVLSAELEEKSATVALPVAQAVRQVVTVHDPCPLRDLSAPRSAARSLIRAQGLEIAEMRANGPKTLCCGEGGSVGLIRPDRAAAWGAMRRQEAAAMPVLTYCAGCAGFLERAGVRTIHLADLLANPQGALNGTNSPAKSPWTYLHRLLLKRRLRKELR